jgi:hypothetical protein
VSAPTPPPSTDGATRVAAPTDPSQTSTGELIGQGSDQLTRLVRDEVRLAQAEVTQKAKRMGIGIGLFGGAGVVALLGVSALVTAAILGLANVLPTETIASVQADIDTVKKGISR